jgi:hypothetical protein
MARPRKSPEERRDDRIYPRFTTAERVQIELNASALGISPAEFTRRRTLGYRLPEAAAVEQARASLGAGFNRVAVNLNQTVRKLNSLNTGPVPSALENEAQALIDRINAEMDKLYGPGGNEDGPGL